MMMMMEDDRPSLAQGEFKMHSQAEYFLELGSSSGNIIELVDESRLSDESQWFSHLGFDVMLLSNELIERIPVIREINAIAEVDRVVVLSMPAYSTYNWHTDDHRNATVNLLINNHDNSHCLFGEPLDENRSSFLELKYKPNTFYLFNTKRQHMVINRGERRYMMSLQFNSELGYIDIRDEWLDSNSLSSLKAS